MALDSYSNLKTAIKSWLSKGSELDDFLDDFIDICEARLRREARLRDMLSLATTSLSDTTRSVALPSDFLAFKYIRIRDPENTSGGPRYLQPALVQITDEEMTRRSSNTEGAPAFYTVNDTVEFDRPADQDYTVEWRYYVDVTSLDDTNTTNEILQFAPDLYLYGALASSAPVLQHDDRVPLWESLYAKALEGTNQQQRMSVRAGPKVARLRGYVP